MNKQQPLTPKYWIGHDESTDDVYLDTAAKSFTDCEKKMDEKFGSSRWREVETVKASLMEINLVDLTENA